MMRVLGKRWNLPQVFVEGDLGGPCLEYSGIGFLSVSNLDLQSLAHCIPLWQQGQIFGGFLFLYIFSFIYLFIFLAFLGPSLFKWFLFLHPLFPFLKAAAVVSATICIF